MPSSSAWDTTAYPYPTDPDVLSTLIFNIKRTDLKIDELRDETVAQVNQVRAWSKTLELT